jgi:hypothetical protein
MLLSGMRAERLPREVTMRPRWPLPALSARLRARLRNRAHRIRSVANSANIAALKTLCAEPGYPKDDPIRRLAAILSTVSPLSENAAYCGMDDRSGSQGEIRTETLPGAWDLSGRARRAYVERISLDLLAEI